MESIDPVETVTFRDLRSGITAQRILAGERLTLRIGEYLIADIVPRSLSERGVRPGNHGPRVATEETVFFTKN